MSTLFSPRFNLIRSVLFLVLLFCAIVVLGIDGHLISGVDLVGGIFAYLIFLVVWTLVTVIGLIFVLGLMAPYHGLTQLKFELPFVALLWVMWLAGAASATDRLSFYLSYCGGSTYRDAFGYTYSVSGASCSEPRALLAFLWIGWLTLTALLGFLVVSAYLEHSKGHTEVWSTPTAAYPFGTTTSTKGIGGGGGARGVEAQQMGNVQGQEQVVGQPGQAAVANEQHVEPKVETTA